MVVLLRFLRADSLVVSTSDSSLESTDPSEFSAKMALKRSREGRSTYTCACIYMYNKINNSLSITCLLGAVGSASVS